MAQRFFALLRGIVWTSHRFRVVCGRVYGKCLKPEATVTFELSIII